MTERRYQIGVVGTFADKELSEELNELARVVGKEIAKDGHILVFGPELDGDSLSTRAALGAKEAGGVTIGILYGSKGELFAPDSADYVIWTGAERGGPRESVLVLSCDGIIAISGGSGTLTEMMIAYMNRRPVVVLENTGGWADKIANQFFDHRQRAKAVGAITPEDAVGKIIDILDDTRSRRILSKEDLLKADEFKALKELIRRKSLLIGSKNDFEVNQLLSTDFETQKQKIGFALLANYCFKTAMGLSGVSVTEDRKGRINFVSKNGGILGFLGEKIYEDPFSRNVYYIDIVGIDQELNDRGIGRYLLSESLNHYIGRARPDVVVLVTRTQNPMLVSIVRGSLPSNQPLYPFAAAKEEWKQSVNWLVKGGLISRNKRPDSFFSADDSLVYWGAYGKRGDGSTWEDMTKPYKIDWDRPMSLLMKKYLEEKGTGVTEMLTKGHALVIGSFLEIKNSRIVIKG